MFTGLATAGGKELSSPGSNHGRVVKGMALFNIYLISSRYAMHKPRRRITASFFINKNHDLNQLAVA